MSESGEATPHHKSAPPLFFSPAFRLRDGTLESQERIQTSGSSLVFTGRAQLLVPALSELVELESGSFSVLGRPFRDLLSSHEAGYAPLALPLPARARLGEALNLSARLVGVDKTGVAHAMDRCHLSGQKKRSLGELTRLQSRLAALAHALCGQPQLLILEDLFSDLDEAESEVIEAILDVELRDRKWIFALDPESTSARSILMLADEVIGATGGRLTPPVRADTLRSHGFWVLCSGNLDSFSARLRNLGAEVTQSPHEGMLRVHGAQGLEIYRAAGEENTLILELSPTAQADSSVGHARSDS